MINFYKNKKGARAQTKPARASWVEKEDLNIYLEYYKWVRGKNWNVDSEKEILRLTGEISTGSLARGL